MAEDILGVLPAGLGDFIENSCGLSMESFRLIESEKMPEPQRSLLCHDIDMTSTLSDFHGSALTVEMLQKKILKETYIREVYLRTAYSRKIVEYGVIAIRLKSFKPGQRKIIERDREPLGGLLHQFKIEFVSAPLCFFWLSEGGLTPNPVAGFGRGKYYGRFNKLSGPSGQTLAWIMEILPG